MQEKLNASWEGLDFDKNDILFGALVKCACEEERKKDLSEAQAEETKGETAQEKHSRQLLEKYLRRQSRIQVLKKGYRAVQKVAVFLVVVFVGFTYAVVNVEAVNQAVVGWLTEVHQTHTDLSVIIGNDSEVDLSKVTVNWAPDGISIIRNEGSSASFQVLFNNTPVGTIMCQSHDSNMTLNTENAVVSYLSLSGFDKTMVIERSESIITVASNENIVITITVGKQEGYPFTAGEVLQILQNIDY